MSRNARTGLIRVARRAGNMQATAEANRKTPATTASTEAPRKLLSVQRCTVSLSPMLSRMPRSSPAPVVRAVEVSVMKRTLSRGAPRGVDRRHPILGYRGRYALRPHPPLGSRGWQRVWSTDLHHRLHIPQSSDFTLQLRCCTECLRKLL